MLLDHVALLLHGRVTLEPFWNQKENLMPSSDKKWAWIKDIPSTFFVKHYFNDFTFNTFDTLLKRSKSTQILRLIMTIDLNWFEEKSSSPGHSEIKRSRNSYFQVLLPTKPLFQRNVLPSLPQKESNYHPIVRLLCFGYLGGPRVVKQGL